MSLSWKEFSVSPPSDWYPSSSILTHSRSDQTTNANCKNICFSPSLGIPQGVCGHAGPRWNIFRTRTDSRTWKFQNPVGSDWMGSCWAYFYKILGPLVWSEGSWVQLEIHSTEHRLERRIGTITTQQSKSKFYTGMAYDRVEPNHNPI